MLSIGNVLAESAAVVRYFVALRQMTCALLLCRLSVSDSSPPKDTVVSARKVPLVRARFPPSRSQWSVFSVCCSPTTVAWAFLMRGTKVG
jgi:hypothetical protein